MPPYAIERDRARRRNGNQYSDNGDVDVDVQGGSRQQQSGCEGQKYERESDKLSLPSIERERGVQLLGGNVRRPAKRLAFNRLLDDVEREKRSCRGVGPHAMRLLEDEEDGQGSHDQR